MAIMRKLVKKPILGACVHSNENILKSENKIRIQ